MQELLWRKKVYPIAQDSIHFLICAPIFFGLFVIGWTQRIKTGAALPPCDKLSEEATEIHWKFQSNGSIIIESKEDIQKD